MLTIFYFHFFISSFLFTLTTIILYTFSVYKSREMLWSFYFHFFHNFTFSKILYYYYTTKGAACQEIKQWKRFHLAAAFTLLWKRFHFSSLCYQTLTLWKRFHFLLLRSRFMKTLSYLSCCCFSFYENVFIFRSAKTFTLKRKYVKP